MLHSGTSQLGRVLKALHPTFVRVDERSAADLILFAKEYSKHLNYYNYANEVDGNWLPLMRMDVSVILATLSSQKVDRYISVIRKELAWLVNKENINVAELKDHFTLLFNFTYSWLYEVELQSQQLPEEWPFKSWLTDTVRSALAELRYKLDQYYMKAALENLTSDAVIQPDFILPFTIFHIKELKVQYWKEEWEFTIDPDQYFDPQFYGATTVSKIRNIAVHNLFTGVLESIFKQAAIISKKANESLEKSFTDFPAHTPHYALFLTFIKLFRFAQNEINNYTERHLNFYYKDILQLLPKPPVPDYAHLIIELQKNVHQKLVTKNTLFKAGKDADGNELLYSGEKDVVINTAEIAAIKSILAISKNGSNDYQSVYASPVANSADGKGEAIKGEDKSWSPFGKQLATNFATHGFAIATHLLFMQEGDRIIILVGEAEQNLPVGKALFVVKPTVKLTGEKDWEPAKVESFALHPRDPKKFYLVCSLTPAASAIVPFNALIHKDVYNTSYPVMRVTFTSTQNYNAAKIWSSIQLKNLSLQVSVAGLKNLVVKNDLSVLDTSKPFQPFGPTPYAGSAFIIGSKEIFQKENASVKLNFEWDKIPQPEGIISHMSFIKSGAPVSNNIIDLRHDTFFNYETYVLKARVSHLQNGIWGNAESDQKLFTSQQMFGDDLVDHYKECGDLADFRNRKLFASYPETSFTSAQDVDIKFDVKGVISPDFTATEIFSNNSINGFIKLELNRDTGNKDFIQRFTQLASKQLKPPLDPYIPQAKSLTADYTASITLNFSASSANPVTTRKWQYFSVHPFGVKEENHFLKNQPSFSIIPVFGNEGELNIGLDKAIPDSSVSILFQLSEGSANPLKSKQDVVWQYLSNNNVWKNFENGKVSDDTNGLLHSGIIAFALPSDIANAPTLMGGEFRWIRVIIVQSSDAICDILELKTQAIKAVWTNVHNPALSYTQITKAGTISKLQTADASIKKTDQPYNSFGGRSVENQEQFYLRSSERLRHKKRAITIWDYERIVLEAFPEIYKVKCLNHTKVRMELTGNEVGDNELAPGCVVVVPVPDVSVIKSSNPLRPLTSLDTLIKIENYLKKITSGFVRIQSRNAVFEEVVIRCRIKFFGNDPGYYHSVLQDDLQRFMCPWAYDGKRDIEFGGRISKSILINFIEERPYVDFVTRFELFLRINNITIPNDMEEVVTSTARSILVIADKSHHSIDYLNVQC